MGFKKGSFSIYVCLSLLLVAGGFFFYQIREVVLTQSNAPSTQNFPFDALYIINQPSRTDRLIDTLKMFKHLNLITSPSTETICFPTRMQALKIPPRSMFFLFNTSYRACFESQRRAIRQIVLDQREAAMIFEDDIDIDVHFKEQITAIVNQLPSDWKLIMFGHCYEKQGSFISNITVDGRVRNIAHSIRPLCAHGYAIKYDTAVSLLKIAEEAKGDFSRHSHGVDHIIQKFAQQNKHGSYSIWPQVVMQRNAGQVNQITKQGPEFYAIKEGFKSLHSLVTSENY
jgi:hypothetical protein